MTTTNSISNTRRTSSPDRRQTARTEFDKLVQNACVPGFHGTASVTICVQDGHIQYTRVAVDRMLK